MSIPVWMSGQSQDGVSMAQGNGSSREAQQVGLLLDQRPVEPVHLAVVTVGVVVAALAASHFIAHQQHRRAAGDKHRE